MELELEIAENQVEFVSERPETLASSSRDLAASSSCESHAKKVSKKMAKPTAPRQPPRGSVGRIPAKKSTSSRMVVCQPRVRGFQEVIPPSRILNSSIFCPLGSGQKPMEQNMSMVDPACMVDPLELVARRSSKLGCAAGNG